MGKLIAIIVIVLILGLVVYAFQDAEFRESLGLGELFMFADPNTSSSPLSYLFEGNQLGWQFPTSSTSTVTDPSTYIGATTTLSAPPPPQIPHGFKANQLSPSFGKVALTAAPTEGFPADYQRITITAQQEGKTSLNLTGWTIKSNAGGYVIPQAVRVYDTLERLQQSDIIVSNGQSVQLFSGQNSRRVNFRLNKCTGYLSNFPLFTPAPPQKCPVPSRTDIFTFTGACQEYIMSLRECEIPRTNAPIPPDDYACRKYLPTLTYEGCVTTHKKDADFLGTEWWIWTGDPLIDPLHDRILLFDKKNLLVAEYVY